VILGFLVVCSIGGLIAFFVYARQHPTRLEKDATLLTYIGVVIWYGGLVWLCLTHEALEKNCHPGGCVRSCAAPQRTQIRDPARVTERAGKPL
jgi:hypothetical protein